MAFARHHTLQEKLQQQQQQQQQQQHTRGDAGRGEYDHNGDDDIDDIESCDADAEFQREVAQIEAVYAERQHASADEFDSKPLKMTVGASGASAVSTHDLSKTTSLRKKRRATVPSDDEEEDAAEPCEPDAAAAAEFQAELQRAGGLSDSPEPPQINENSNDDDAFDIGADSMFD